MVIVEHKKMKKILITSLCLSIAANIYQLVSQQDMSTGGGISGVSPNEQYSVSLMSKRNLNPLSKNHDFYAEITFRGGSISDPIIQKFVIAPINVESEMDYRELDNPIKWADDSSHVTISTPDFEIIKHVNVNTHP